MATGGKNVSETKTRAQQQQNEKKPHVGTLGE